MYDGKIHIHIENSRSSAVVFTATEDHVKGLLERNPDLAPKLRVTLGSSAVDEVARWTEDDLKEYYGQMATADVLVGYSFPTENLRGYAPCLRWIHFISSGVEHVTPFDWVPEGVTLVNNRGVHLPKSGESFAMYLAMLNAQMPRLFTAQRNGRWDRAFTSVIKGKRLAVFGVGHQGGEIAKQAQRMGLRVTGIDPYVTDHPCCEKMVTPEAMKDVLAQSDFLAVAAPLTAKTRGIVGEEVLGWLPKHAGVLNVSRGPLVDQTALQKKLSKGELSGAILDVFDVEPLPADSPLWNTPNLIITPHVSSDDLVNYMPLTLDLTITNLRNELAGRGLVNVVDATREF
ncbi:MAG: D-2-hydroxyacid dehydrogenase [Synergistaceae bacterium]|jgi:phosphoglycerate dehydrogenase-like enzyme|nr:D-2-hydroxyacid dehydrogenase [Synergistaceae bacterium]